MQEWHPRHNPWLITLTVMMAVFMEVLDTSIANIALPHIAGSLSATPEEATWVLTSYLVSNAIVLPMTGWLGNYFGRKRVLLIVHHACSRSRRRCAGWRGICRRWCWRGFFRARRRRDGADRAVHHARKFPAAKTRRGDGGVRAGRGGRADPRPDRSAAGSRTTIPGAGFFTSTCRWAFSRLLMAKWLVEDPPYIKRNRAGDD